MIEFGTHPPTAEEMIELSQAKAGYIWSQIRIVILRAVGLVKAEELLKMPYEDFFEDLFMEAHRGMVEADTRNKQARKAAKALSHIESTWDRESPNAREHADMTALERMNDILDAVNTTYNGE